MKKIIGIILGIFLLAQFSVGQVPYFQHYSLLKKNEPVQVNVIFQDKSGFIWYGTNKGLFKFDGINQQRLTVTDSLPDENVTAIAQDSLGRIWTGHRNGKLAFIEKGIIKNFDPREGSSSQEISDILFDRKGNLWFSTLNDGLYYYLHDRLYRLDDQDGMPDIFVYDIVEDSNGNIWAGSDGGVAICTLNGSKVSIKIIDTDHGLADNIVKKLVMDKDNTVWMGTEDAGIINYDPVSGKFKPLLKDWKYGTISDFILTGNQVWISSLQSGLMVHDRNLEQSKVYNASTGSDFMSINTLLRDDEGNIWAGSKTGVMRTLGDHVEYIETFDPYKNVNVLAVTLDKQNNLWFSTKEGLFMRKVDESGMISIEKPLLNTLFRGFTTISLYTDSAGYIWAGLYGEGALRINPQTKKIKYLHQELRNGNILNITGRGSMVWLATLGGGTQINFSGEQLSVKNYGRQEGLVSDYIYQIFLDSQDRVWFATDGKGVDMMDGEGFHHFEEGLNSKVVYGFAEDSDHNLWVNVQGDGLYKFEGKKFLSFSREIRLRDNNINCFTADKFGNLVMMHDLGIDIYDIRNNKIRYLGDEVGIRNKKPNLNALTKDDQDRIYLGTDGGIILYSGLTNDLLPSPQPLIDNLRVVDQNVDLSKNLRFKYDQNSMTINYLGIWYQNPVNLNFQYRLENYDRDWIASRNHAATYSSLPPGEYTFRLRVSDTDDFKDLKEASFRFIVQPPFWSTTWFYILSVIVIIFSGYAYLQYREKSLLEEKKILEERVTERTKEIQKQSEEIQAQNEEIQAQGEEIKGINDNLELLVLARTLELEKKNKALEESAFIIAHELRAPVASVLGLINLITKSELNDEARIVVKHMEDSAEKLNKVVSTITKAIERGDK